MREECVSPGGLRVSSLLMYAGRMELGDTLSRARLPHSPALAGQDSCWKRCCICIADIAWITGTFLDTKIQKDAFTPDRFRGAVLLRKN